MNDEQQRAGPVNSSPVDWHDAQQITDLPEVDELLRDFAEDPTGDAGTMIVRAVMQAVRQDSEPTKGDFQTFLSEADKAGVTHLNFRGLDLSDKPVKGPSDEEIKTLSYTFNKVEGHPSHFYAVFDCVGFARALLARYGNAAQPAASVEPVGDESTAEFIRSIPTGYFNHSRRGQEANREAVAQLVSQHVQPASGDSVLKYYSNHADMQSNEILKYQKRIRDLENKPHWQPIDTAPKDNKRPLYLARFNEEGVLRELDFDGSWHYWQESYELPHINGYCWFSANGIEEPTHWAYQDEVMPISI